MSLISSDPAGADSARKASGAKQTAIRVPKTAEVVADQIRGRIIRGELSEGDFLSPEGQMLATLGISRPTLREAFRILEAENLITVMRGSRSGARVHQPRVEAAARYVGFVLQAQNTTLADIYEARLAIEPYVARRLAETRPEGAVQRLRDEIQRLQEMVDERRYIDFMIALAEFHRLLVELSGERTLLLVTQLLQEILSRHQVAFFKENSVPDSVQRQRSFLGLRSFTKLVNLIESRDGAGAEKHWRLHLENANASWVPAEHQSKIVDVLS